MLFACLYIQLYLHLLWVKERKKPPLPFARGDIKLDFSTMYEVALTHSTHQIKIHLGEYCLIQRVDELLSKNDENLSKFKHKKANK